MTAVMHSGSTLSAVGSVTAPTVDGNATVEASTVGAVVIIPEPEPAVRETIGMYVVELRWDAPTTPDESTTLSAWVDGECVQMGMQQGDDFGLLMELADDGSILPPWSDGQIVDE